MEKIESLNLINKDIEVKPNYNLENKSTYIEVYFNDRGQVLIVGAIDNNYIYWASLTNIDNREINSSIFNHISQGNIEKVSNLYRALNEVKLSYDEVMHWVKIRLTRKENDKMGWNTPFDGNYSGSNHLVHNGNFFARDINRYLKQVHDRCKYREAGGAYEMVLDYYLAILKDYKEDIYYYQKVKNLIDIIKAEDYLYGSENPEIRRKYIELREISSVLYNRYMTAVR